jgi:hypothetical protein
MQENLLKEAYMRVIKTMILSCFMMLSMNSLANTFAEIQQQAEQGNALAQKIHRNQQNGC